MSTAPSASAKTSKKERPHPFRRAILRGLGVVLPPLLTIVVFLWAWTVIEVYVLVPVEELAKHAIVLARLDVLREIPEDVSPEEILVTHDGEIVALQELIGTVPAAHLIDDRVQARGGHILSFRDDGTIYVQVASGEWIPQYVYDTVRANPGPLLVNNATGRDYYDRYVRTQYLRRALVIPVFLIIFIGILYFIGLSFAAGVGRFLWSSFESLIQRVPIIRNVYGSVKQVTDFVFSEREIEFNRVVAVEYPRKGIWSIGFVTGESMLDIRCAANEPVVAVLIANSPVPATGYTITVLKSETVDLNVSVDQAIQFIVSCGVVVPAQQQYEREQVGNEVATAIARHSGHNGDAKQDSAAIGPAEHQTES